MNIRKIVNYVTLGILIIVIIVTALSSFYMVGDNQTYVIDTLGTLSLVDSPGLHFKTPFIQKATKYSKTLSGMAIGYDEVTEESIYADSRMITADFNLVDIDFYMEYAISDPIKYHTIAEAPEQILRDLTRSYIRDTVGVFPIDDVLTTGKNAIQLQIKEKLTERLMKEDFGVMLHNIYIQTSEAPPEVQSAFKEVENAKQTKETTINGAHKYSNENLPAAEAQADALIKQAEAIKEARISEAQGQADRFNDLYTAYRNFPEVTRYRMLLEVMEKVLKGKTIVIEGVEGQTDKIYPITPFTTTQPAAVASTVIEPEIDPYYDETID